MRRPIRLLKIGDLSGAFTERTTTGAEALRSTRKAGSRENSAPPASRWSPSVRVVAVAHIYMIVHGGAECAQLDASRVRYHLSLKGVRKRRIEA